MKVKIEFQIDSNDRKIVEIWLEKMTKSMRLSRYLVPGSWKIEVDR